MQIESSKKHILLLQELLRKRLAGTQVGSQALHKKAEPCPEQHTSKEKGRQGLLLLYTRGTGWVSNPSRTLWDFRGRWRRVDLLVQSVEDQNVHQKDDGSTTQGNMDPRHGAIFSLNHPLHHDAQRPAPHQARLPHSNILLPHHNILSQAHCVIYWDEHSALFQQARGWRVCAAFRWT